MNNRVLFVFVLFLLSLYGLFRLFSGHREQAFRAELIRIDTAAVSSVVVNLKGESGDEVTLLRESNGWIATDGVRSVRAVPGTINTLLGHLTLIRTEKLASGDPGQWHAFGVSEENGTRIRVYQGRNVVEDFIIGRFNADPQTGSGASFIRLAGQNEVYAIDAFQALSLCRDLNAYRSRSLLDIPDGTTIDEIGIQRPDTAFRFTRSGRRWLLNNDSLTDSLAIDRFILSLRHLSGEQFADDFDELLLDRIERQSLIIHSRQLSEPLVIDIFRDSSRQLPFIIRSNQFPENFFASDSNGLFRRLQMPF